MATQPRCRLPQLKFLQQRVHEEIAGYLVKEIQTVTAKLFGQVLLVLLESSAPIPVPFPNDPFYLWQQRWDGQFVQSSIVGIYHRCQYRHTALDPLVMLPIFEESLNVARVVPLKHEGSYPFLGLIRWK